jgi:outer membrane protein
MRMKPLWAALLALGLTGAHAADLLQAWQAARQHDPDMAVAQSALQAGQARRDQASALWRPTVAATAAGGAMGSRTSTAGASFSAPAMGTSSDVAFNTSVDNGPGARWSIGARMPIYSPERTAQGRKLTLSADLADVQWQAAEQALMLQTAERYFAVALAQDALRLLQRQQTAVSKAMVEAQDRFELGDAPVTDTHEAAARARGIDAQVLAAEVDLQIAQRALADTTGWSVDALQVAPAPAWLATPALPAMPQWLDQAAAANPGLRQQTLAVEVARQDVAQYARGAGTTVDLVAQASREHLSGSGRYGHGSNTAQRHMVGVQVTVPLYTGGQRSARQQELLHLQTKAEAELDRARQQVAQQTRAAWLRLQSGAARTDAQNAALRASQARLDATQLGRQVGDRTTLDLLNAQNDAAGAELAMAQLRTSLTLERLRLLALTGQLDERALHAATVDAPAPK